MRKFFKRVGFVVLTAGAAVAAQGQVVSPGTTGLGTNVDAALLAAGTGINWVSNASVTIGLLLLGLAVLGAVFMRAKFSKPK